MSVHSACSFIAALCLGLALGCGTSEVPSAVRGASGSAVFSCAGLDAEVAAFEYRIHSGAGELIVERTLEASDGVAFELWLPPGRDYSVTVSADAGDGRSCTGSTVALDQRNEVTIELRCSGGGEQVRVVGTLSPPCPTVAIGSLDAILEVGSSVVLSANVEGMLDSEPVWEASLGEIDVVDGALRFTCTAPGAGSIRLRATAGDCEATDSVSVTCAAASATSPCDGLGNACHVVAESSEAADECHGLGHAGDESACAASRGACVDTCGAALCAELSSLCHAVDPGQGPLHECHELGHAADATACFARGRECFDLCTRAHQEPVTIEFSAQVLGAPFACGAKYSSLGSSPTSAEPRDFRFFVHDVRLLDDSGNATAVELDQRAPWQARGTALLDFEDGTGGCLEGDAAVNATLTGRVAPGTYTALAFRVGVPETANHEDPALQPAPLGAGAMSWGWLSGYKFMRAELGTASGGGVLHLGATGCSGEPASDRVSCARSNRPDVTLMGFDPATTRVVADVGALFAGVDLTSAGPCHSSGDACGPIFQSLGLDLQSGQSAGEQSVFSVSPRD